MQRFQVEMLLFRMIAHVILTSRTDTVINHTLCLKKRTNFETV